VSKVYLLTDGDFDLLFAEVDRDPSHGTRGGSSDVLTETEKEAHAQAHRFFNYVIRCWASKVRT
jgi:hypothetical protein